LVDVTDIAGLMNNVNIISGPGIKFMVDNELWNVAASACESSCFANNPTQQIGDGHCATSCAARASCWRIPA
jgi:hypothetical protein